MVRESNATGVVQWSNGDNVLLAPRTGWGIHESLTQDLQDVSQGYDAVRVTLVCLVGA